jgi:hypothetical protein
MSRSTSLATWWGVSPLVLGLAKIGLILTGLLVVFGPGPKYEEGFLVMFFGMLLVPLAFVSAVLSVTARFTAVVYPLLWCFGALVTWLHVARHYGYSLVNWEWFRLVGAVALWGILGLVGVNKLACVIRWGLRSCRQAT